MSIILRALRRLLRQPAPTDEQISAIIREKIINGGGKCGDNFDLISSSIDLGEPYLVSIGDNVTLTGVKVLTHDASLKKTLGYSKVGPVSIGNNVFVGWGSVILMNTKIGNNVVIGAGSVVSSDIPDNSVAVGNPCRVICSFDEYVQKMRNKMAEVPVIDKCPSEIQGDKHLEDIIIKNGYAFIR